MTQPAKPSPDNPWSAPVTVSQIPETGLHSVLEANDAQRAALAAAAGLRDVSSAQASFDLSHAAGGRVQVVGRVTARVGQTCVVTLDPIDCDIDEPIDLMFVPEAEIKHLEDLVDDDAEDEEIPDPPEPIVNDSIDLGRLATDALFLGIDPYPRKPGAVFEPPPEVVDPEDHPFAALKALQEGKEPGTQSKKPKGK
jgi:uncharacterized metal-binding protein YceD (DUF177 family)